MIDLAEGVLGEFAERSHASTSRRDGRFVERSRPCWPVVALDLPCWVSRYESHRKIAARIAKRRIARRRVLWLPT